MVKPQVYGEKNCKDDNGDLHKFSHDESAIDMETYNNFPNNFDVQGIIEALTTGEGFAIVKNAVCKEDIQIIKERVLYFTDMQKEEHEQNETLKRNENINPIEKQNHFHGLIWGLINKGRIFEKLVLHPMIQNVSTCYVEKTPKFLATPPTLLLLESQDNALTSTIRTIPPFSRQMKNFVIR